MRIFPTDRGIAFAIMLLFLWTSAVILHDQLLVLLAVVASLTPAIDFIKLFLTSRKLILEVRRTPVQDVWVWEKPGFEVVSKSFFEPVNLPEWVRVGSVDVKDGALLYRFEAVFKYSGVYSIEKLGARVFSKLGLFELLDEMFVGASFRVKPATLFWLQRALTLLGVVGGFETPTPQEASPQAIYLRSTPEEYIGSREYQPGDDLRFIDWKSTARRQELIIKEFRGEAGLKPTLAFDLRCMGPYTCDAVASATLSLAVGLALQSTQVSGLYEVELGRFLTFRNAYELLSYVVKKVLESRVVEELDLYEFIEPPTLDEIRRILKEVAGLNAKPVSKPQQGTLTRGNIIYATTLLHATSEVIDLALSTIKNGGIMSLIVPAEPWIDARDDLIAEKIKISFHRAIRKLLSLGVNVFPCGRGGPKTFIVEASS